MVENVCSGSNVIPISKSLSSLDWMKALYRKYPSLPTFLILLEATIVSGARVEDLESDLDLLFGIGDDQYYAVMGTDFSRALFNEYVLNENWDTIRPWFFSPKTLFGACDLVWKAIDATADNYFVLDYKGFFVGLDDYQDLNNNVGNESDDSISSDAVDTVKTLINSKKLSGLIGEAIRADLERENFNREVSDRAASVGLRFVPVWTLLEQFSNDKDSMGELVSDLSDYIGQYFLKKSPTTKQASSEDNLSIARIASFLIFYPLVRRYTDREISSLQEFFDARISYFTEIKIGHEAEIYKDYLVAISNYLMMSAVLDVGSISNRLITKEEAIGEYITDSVALNRGLACLFCLPQVGLSRVLRNYNFYEGDQCVSHLGKLISACNYGFSSGEGRNEIVELFDNVYLDVKSLGDGFRSQLIRRMSSWFFPLDMINDLPSIYNEFWGDCAILGKISNALTRCDETGYYGSVFQDQIISNDFFLDGIDLSDASTHPAIFAIKLSNEVAFPKFNIRDMLAFSQSLIDIGQMRQSCAVVGMLFSFCSLNKYFNNEVVIDIPVIMNILRELSGYPSFSVVRGEISMFLSMLGDDASVRIKGSIGEYRSNDKRANLTLINGFGDIFDTSRRAIEGLGVNVGLLAPMASSDIIKGYALTRDESLKKLDWPEAALRSYFSSIERELRGRTPVIGSKLSDELENKGIRVEWRKGRGQLGGLGAYKLLLERLPRMSSAAQVELHKLARLSFHPDNVLFTSLLGKLVPLRNEASHPEDYSKEDILRSVATTEKILFEDGLVRILCDTVVK